jgi:hypothetical protein
MKTLSHIVLLAIAVATLAACQQSGEGPAKPAGSSSTQISQK